jgi:hypothetical protein
MKSIKNLLTKIRQASNISIHNNKNLKAIINIKSVFKELLL